MRREKGLINIIVFLVCICSLGFMIWLSIDAFYELRSNQAAWYSFVGSFWGSGVALIISITSITLTIYYERERNKDEKRKVLTKIAPYFKIASDSQPKVVDNEDNLVSLEFILTNIGQGYARTPYLKKIENDNNENKLEILFILGNLPITFEKEKPARIKVICKKSDKPQDADIECIFFDMMNNTHIQSLYITNMFNDTGLLCYERHPTLVKEP